jgi:hypothetical protein
MKRKRNTLVVAAGLALLGVAAWWVQQQRALTRRIDCLSALRSTGVALALYRHDFDGNLPPDLALMGAGDHLSSACLFFCPRGHKAPGTWPEVAEWMDYTYVSWPAVAEATASYPLMYDRRLANHGGKGINVLIVEQTIHPASPGDPGSFHGQFFWDEGAVWLQRFAREHPDLRIPLPEDLKRTP